MILNICNCVLFIVRKWREIKKSRLNNRPKGPTEGTYIFPLVDDL